jgi:protein-tyrosine phosphatase
MAEAIARHLLGGAATVQSAGMDTAPGMRATAEAIQVMKERGFDISRHRSREVTALKLTEFDFVVVLNPCLKASLERVPGFDGARLKVLCIDDPYGQGIAEYRRCANLLECALGSLFGNYRDA